MDAHATSSAELAPVGPASEDIRGAVGRICQSPALRSSPQLASFLRFVVEAALDGRSRHIKGYTIAVEALGRDPNFDPQIDPIVRVEASRLRRALDQYYAGSGRAGPVIIELPRGRYVPAFRWRVLGHAASSGTGAERGGACPADVFRACPRTSDLHSLDALLQRLLDHRRQQIEQLRAEIRLAKQALEQCRRLLRSPIAAQRSAPADAAREKADRPQACR